MMDQAWEARVSKLRSELKEEVKQELADEEDEKKRIADEELAEQARTAVNASAAKPSTWPFGNKDSKKIFDLSKMTKLQSLPDDKVIVVLPRYNKDSKGNIIGYDQNACEIQFFDGTDHDDRAKPDKGTGNTIYSMLGQEIVVVHDPRA